jgi:hypothetical protein
MAEFRSLTTRGSKLAYDGCPVPCDSDDREGTLSGISGLSALCASAACTVLFAECGAVSDLDICAGLREGCWSRAIL